MPVNLRKLEEAVGTFLSTAAAVFEFETAAKAVASLMGMKRGPNKELRAKLEPMLLDDPASLYDPKNKGLYGARQAFFKGAHLKITPTIFELKEAILLPGHRFAPFCHAECIPSELKLSAGGAPLKVRRIKIPLEQAVGYFNLLGAEQMFEFFMAEAQENVLVISKGLLDAPICLDVFDMKDFYAQNSFAEGDSLTATVSDWAHGEFTLEKAQKTPSENEAKVWVSRLEDALEQVCENFENYLEIPEQLAYAFFADRGELLHKADGSIDEFQHFADRIEIALQGGRTVLSPKGEHLPDDSALEIPDGIALSKGKTSPSEILREIGTPLTEPELRAFMLDELFQGGSYESFQARCFGENKPAFVDDAQAVIFSNWLEDLWETISEHYSREEDEDKGRLRTELLELVDERLLWLRDLQAENAGKVGDELREKFEELARIAMQLSTILALLNSREQSVSPEDIEGILNTVEKASEKQRSLIDSINLALKRS